MMHDLKQSLAFALLPATVWQALRVALVIGTLLTVINHYDEWLGGTGSSHSLLQIILTYFVPYLVSTHGQVVGHRQR